MNISVILTAIATFVTFNLLVPFEKTFAGPIYLAKSNISILNAVNPPVKPSNSYSILLLGDSMMQFLGDGSDLKNYLKKYYPKKQINVLNYGFGSTNILSVPERLKKDTIRGSETLPPILEREFDVIFIESFGNNPLSDMLLEEGLKKQTEALDQIVKIIKTEKPESAIIFMATVSPNRERYAEGTVNLTTEERRKWADERITYIKNHIEYAKVHKIPLLNVFEKSLDLSGDGNIDYINSQDFIHPSPTGILFISQEIADFIFKKRILPL